MNDGLWMVASSSRSNAWTIPYWRHGFTVLVQGHEAVPWSLLDGAEELRKRRRDGWGSRAAGLGRVDLAV